MDGREASPSRRHRPRFSLGLRLLLVGGATLSVSGAPAQAGNGETTPPTFAGLQSATTCIPGPARHGRNAQPSYDLSWEAATDDVTPSNEIVYNVYQATTAGGEEFSRPTYKTDPGATSFDTPRLSSVKAYYFVVRARDGAGNEDSNTVEIRGRNLCR